MSDTSRAQGAALASSMPAADPLFVVLTNRPMPAFDDSRRSVYPFDGMPVDKCFFAGKGDKRLMGRLYAAIASRRKKHPTERYRHERMDNGDVYVWRVA
jgi:hypothetical protein